MKIALATPLFPQSIADALHQVEKLIGDAVSKEAEIICFPETYIPGYPGVDVPVESNQPEKLRLALVKVCELAKNYAIAVIIPMDWYEDDVVYNLAHVVSNTGEHLGYQTKNQLDPSEDGIWAPGTRRNIFEVSGVKFGITICHEGFRYPESVRWAAKQGAKIVFHPQCTGSNREGSLPAEWGHKDNPYYEKAIMMRAMENTIYFASINYAFKYPDSATSMIAPDGTCIAFQPYAEAGVLVVDIDVPAATGLLAKRFKGGLY